MFASLSVDYFPSINLISIDLVLSSMYRNCIYYLVSEMKELVIWSLSGKTTNLEIIHKKAPKDAVGEMVSIATETDRTLYFDFLPLDLGQVAGMRTRFQLYTVPGQIYYNATRKLVLQGVDGVIFVADSSPDKMAENLESLQNLRDNLAEMNLTIDDIPLVLQYNKRDLPQAMSVADINAQLNPMGAPVFEGVAREGKGVFATLKEISRLVIEKLNKDQNWRIRGLCSTGRHPRNRHQHCRQHNRTQTHTHDNPRKMA